jgi:HNH endonuclease
MSDSLKPRIKRGFGPSGKLRPHNLRTRALPHLLEDFERRCAYSMRHVEIAGGVRQMEIDHFDPTLRSEARDSYLNLMLATRHCNNMKKDGWPVAHQIAAGSRLLNPTKEPDYGRHLFEDPKTHELIGVTPAGRYHIDILDLNHDTFVWERRKRAVYLKLRGESPVTFLGPLDKLHQLLQMLQEQFELFIPYVAPPPAPTNSPQTPSAV